MGILVTNDDGPHAPGLVALALALQTVGDVHVIAPNRNWSASGHVKTMHEPLRAHAYTLDSNVPALQISGGPADAVALGLMGLIDAPIDLVVTGINRGANVGHDITYSGTVTAAIEGAISGVPALAVSLDTYDEHADYAVAAQIAADLARKILEKRLPSKTLLSVNVPALPKAQIRGIRITRMGTRIYRDALVRNTDPRGQPYFWIGGQPPTGIAEPGTDFWALANGFISVTPIQLDFTAYGFMDTLRDWETER
ncbi:MAG: 5'/3'-nucleotidase SurE [Anaerolineae bacterium]|nr:5'/3'-nucleotidase SurE [Anaerolineae bacterium]